MNSNKINWYSEIKMTHLRLVWDYLDTIFENDNYDTNEFNDVFDMMNNNGNI